MKKVAVVLGLLTVTAFVYADVIPGGNGFYWEDQFGDPIDAYVEAMPGDTVTVWHITNQLGGWVPLSQIRAELWWDTAVIANPGDGDPLTYVKPTYTYNGLQGTGLGSEVANADNYNAGEDWSTPQYDHYLKLDFYATMWRFENMRVVGYEIPIRPDAPLGTTTLGATFIGVYYYGGVYWNDVVDAPNPLALTINVVPEPATMGLLGLGGLTALLRRRKK
jgi:hypothetical protein